MSRFVFVLVCAGAALGAGCGTLSPQSGAVEQPGEMSGLLNESETFGTGLRQTDGRGPRAEITYERLVGTIGP
jgi:hypothetical protein